MIEKVQIEVTTDCNLNCEYCLKPNNAIEISEEVVEKISGIAKRFIFYGFGEPMLNKRLKKFVELLNHEAILSTNGMVDENFYEVAQLFDVVGVSIDTAGFRKGFVFEKAIKKLEKLELAFAQFVILEENFKDTLSLVPLLAEKGIQILVTNAIAPNSAIYDRTLYFEGSRINLGHVQLSKGEIMEIIHKNFYIDPYRKSTVSKYPNFQAIIEAKQKIIKARMAEEEILRVKSSLKDNAIDFRVPEFFGESEKRSCPYLNSIFVRADGKVSVCMELAYTHKEFVNRKGKVIEAFILGNLLEQEIDDILENLREFEKNRKNMDFPWCGDCAHVFGCWFLEHGMDCYGNKPSCCECLYSVGIAKCLV